MTDKKSGIRGEFEEVFDKVHIGDDDLRYIPITDQYTWTKAEKLDSAKWGATWFSEYILFCSQGHFRTETEYYLFADKVRQLTKELSNDQG